jgi:F0F1-type ATP synthase assembly protein I
MLGAGLTLVVTVGVFAFGGHLLDGWLGTRPLFLLLGLVFGAIGGFIHLFSVVAPGLLPWSRSRTGRQSGDKGSGSHPADSEQFPEPPKRPPEP